MSYLNALRLNFAGRFQANVSTVNNDPAHFDNATFVPDYQKMQGPRMIPPNGWFNPQGDAAWRLLGCRVTAAWTPQGAVEDGDPVLNAIVADSDTRAPAKLVDLDSEQQLVSEIWGLQVRIANADGTTLMAGDFEPAAFMDIWDRSTAASSGDTIAGAMYQSVLTNLQWADVSASTFLTKLKQAASDGVLSIKFNVDSFNMSFKSPDFMTGRIVGTIGPATLEEPRHLLIGRQFMAAAGTGGNFFKPAGGINFFAGVVDPSGSIYLDLGNALTTGADGAINDQGELTLSVYDPELSPSNRAGSIAEVGKIPSQGPVGYASDPEWYLRTAGIVVLPIQATLLPLVQASPLTLAGMGNVVFISEWSSGAFVRADRFVYRLSPGDRVEIPVYAMQWGQPLPGVQISFPLDPSQLQPGSGFPYVAPSPPVATPTTALAFDDDTVTTGSDGRAVLSLSVTDPGTPRWFNNGTDFGIDGQVYGIRPEFTNALRYNGPVNQWNFVSILLWSGFRAAMPVTWTVVQPIFQQYANLYPVMNRFLDLADYDSVVANVHLLRLAFGLDPADPNSMPVTRDLSPAKRQAILTWLTRPLPGVAPGVAPAPKAAAPAAAAIPAATAAMPAMTPPQGGKAAAAARRLVLQTR